VRLAAYSNPPVFSTYYGAEGATDADVSAAINDGVGLVAYRGHGSSSSWSSWNLGNESYNSTDVNALTNVQTPVVWSFACSNSQLSSNDCLAEVWMEQVDNGAVSHYGATVPSYTTQNHELDRQMFQAVYDEGLVIQAQAIEFGEEMMGVLEGDDNAWMYLLLGDPAQSIRTDPGFNWEVFLPDLIEIEPGFPYNLHLELHADGTPDPDVLFSVWKPMNDRQVGDEVFTNTYTDSNGKADLVISPETEGWLYFALRGENGEALYDSVRVVRSGTAAPEFGQGALRFWAEPSVMSDGGNLRLSRSLDSSARIEIFDVAGRRVRSIDLAAEQSIAGWDGMDEGGRKVPNGIYLARLRDSSSEHTARMVVVR
jgi:hypothetical protein